MKMHKRIMHTLPRRTHTNNKQANKQANHTLATTTTKQQTKNDAELETIHKTKKKTPKKQKRQANEMRTRRAPRHVHGKAPVLHVQPSVLEAR